MKADFTRPPDRQINRFAMSKRDDFINKPDFILSSVWVQEGREWSQSKFFFFNRLFSCHSFCGKSIERTWNSFERRRNSSSFYKVTVFVAFGIFLCFVRIGMNFLSWLRNFTKSMSLSTSTQAVSTTQDKAINWLFFHSLLGKKLFKRDVELLSKGRP